MADKKLGWWVAAVVWAGLIWYLSAQPDLHTTLEQDFLLRKIAHVFEFGVLTWLLANALRHNEFLTTDGVPGDPRRAPGPLQSGSRRTGVQERQDPFYHRYVVVQLLLPAVTTLLYAALDEVHQSWVVGRHGTWHDVLIDAIGIALVTCWIFWRQSRGQSRAAS